MKRASIDQPSEVTSSKRAKEEVDSGKSSDDSNVSLLNIEAVEKCYKMKFPTDFRLMWEFCKKLNPLSPAHALKSSLGLVLVGPYDLLRKTSLKDDDSIAWALHYRFFHDPPEFCTTIIKANDRSLGHWGYFRDIPEELPNFVAFNAAEKDGSFSFEGENLFSAVHRFASKDSSKPDVKSITSKLESWAKKYNLPLDDVTPTIRARNKRMVSKTLNNIGLVVPVDENDIGYRPLPETASSIKKILNKIVSAKNEKDRLVAFEPLDEMVTLVQFANDECDYGEGIELGLDLLTCPNGKIFNAQISQLLGLGYDLLGRKLYSDTVKEHMKNRISGGRVSLVWGKM